MPTYDYECRDCNHVFEVFQQMTDDRLTECPQCKGKLERLIGGGAGIIFKGSGFYVNDYKKKPNPESKPVSDKAPATGKAKSKSSTASS